MKWLSRDMTEVHKSQVWQRDQIGDNENIVLPQEGTGGIMRDEQVTGSRQGKAVVLSAVCY